jgi:hypothetical protein
VLYHVWWNKYFTSSQLNLPRGFSPKNKNMFSTQSDLLAMIALFVKWLAIGCLGRVELLTGIENYLFINTKRLTLEHTKFPNPWIPCLLPLVTDHLPHPINRKVSTCGALPTCSLHGNISLIIMRSS